MAHQLSGIGNVPDAVLDILLDLANDFERFDCTDNFRACRVGDTEGEKQFNQQRDEGCCGDFHEEIEHEGIKYFIGFNHGH